MDIQIIKKAYEIDLDKLQGGYLHDPIKCHAETRNKAKSILLEKIRYDYWKLKSTGAELNYVNIPVKRCPGHDRVVFDGSQVYRGQIDGIIKDKERNSALDEILNNDSIKYCYILKRGYYCPHFTGYTDHRTEAGVYDKVEAVEHARSVREIRLERVDIDEHNKLIESKIQDLKTRLLPPLPQKQ